MSGLPLNSLRALAAIYDTGGVRSAARLLNVTHSAVSRHLRELEAWLGIPIIEERKGSSRLRFTPQGEALGKAAASGFAEIGHAVDSAREQRRANSVTIATTASFAARWLLPRLPGFLSGQNWVEVSIVVNQAVLQPEDQGADIVLRMGQGPWSDGVAEPLMDDTLFPVATAQYWGGLGQRSREEKVRSARLLHDRDPASAWEKWFSAYPTEGIDLRAGPRFTSSDLVLRGATLGIGIALARGRLAEDEVNAGNLIRPFGDAQINVPSAYWLIRASRSRARAAESAVLDWIRKEATATRQSSSASSAGGKRSFGDRP